MERFKATLVASFRTKVIVPVVAAMVLLMAVSMWLVNRRVTRQLQDDATQMLVTADAVLRKFQEHQANELKLRYRNIANEPRFRAVAGLQDGVTMQGFMNDLFSEKAAEVMLVTTDAEKRLASVAEDPRLNLDQFQMSCASTIRRAGEGQLAADTIQVGERLFDIVSVPMRAGNEMFGVITFGVQNAAADTFKNLMQTDLVLFSDGQVVSSTITQPDSYALLAEKVSQLSHMRSKAGFNPIEQITLNHEDYLCRAGSLGAQDSTHQLRYLVLCSYERPMQVLRTTQQLILWVSLLGILLGAAAVWLLVRKVTQPLSELRDSAEAVGRGDFSRRVEVRTQDECGELAYVFNQMIENVKRSREELEASVERLKATQAQLIQSEKLSGVGEFVAGVAHELNNPLTTVMGFSELLKQLDLTPQHRTFVENIHKSAQRCQKIVQSLLGFARRHAPERKPVCVNTLIESALDLLRYQLRTNNISATTQLDPQLPLAMVDSHQIQQVLVNIVNNARQAIEAHEPHGWIKICSEADRKHVRITIRDSGPGISSENLMRIFDPFFTTKDVGKGTGLGLSLCYGIIKEHGGTITPSSRPGEGATFVIELPISHGAGDTTTISTKPKPEAESFAQEGVGKRVLVIDDEEPILHMLREVLNIHGYEVDITSDGEAALRQLSERHYDLALCDWKMPGLNGQQVYERLRDINPAMSKRVIFITGDVINEKIRRFLEEERRNCIPKPFTISEFRSAINKTLAAAA